MVVFPPAKHLYSWAGLTPTNNESARQEKVSKNSES
ncbi:transposase [Neobacillus drentensis]